MSTGQSSHTLGHDTGDDVEHQIPTPFSFNDGPPGEAETRRLACPFLANDPQKYRPSCGRAIGFTTVHRVREHLYRRHCLPPSCRRCRSIFPSDPALAAHLDVPDHERCKTRGGIPAHLAQQGIDPLTKAKLRKRQRAGMTEEEKWKEMFLILFPNSVPPSPYVDCLPGDIDQLRRFTRQEDVRTQFRNWVKNEFHPDGEPTPEFLEYCETRGWNLVSRVVDLFSPSSPTGAAASEPAPSLV